MPFSARNLAALFSAKIGLAAVLAVADLVQPLGNTRAAAHDDGLAVVGATLLTHGTWRRLLVSM
jgi:hypothetical protein